MTVPLGIIAGGGPLPGRVAEAAKAAGRPVFIVALDGYAEPDVVAPFPHAPARLGAAGHILDLLRSNQCRDIVLVGPVRRPSLLHLRPDGGGRPLAGADRAGGVLLAMTVSWLPLSACWAMKGFACWVHTRC